MPVQQVSLGKFQHRTINWYTPVHKLYVMGKGPDGTIYAGRLKHPAFLVAGDNQAEVEREAGRLINARLE